MQTGCVEEAVRRLPVGAELAGHACYYRAAHACGLELALHEGSSHLSYLPADPMFDSLSKERRFRRITRKIGLA